MQRSQGNNQSHLLDAFKSLSCALLCGLLVFQGGQFAWASSEALAPAQLRSALNEDQNPVSANETSSTYAANDESSLRASLDAAKAGDVIKVTSQIKMTDELLIKEAVSIDLQGHTLTCDYPEQLASANVCVINFSGQGESFVRNGIINVSGYSPRSQSSTHCFNAIQIGTQTSLELENVSLSLTYEQNRLGSNPAKVAAVNASGSINIKTNCTISVDVSGDYPADALGFCLKSSDDGASPAPTANLASSSKIVVKNESARYQAGSVDWGNTFTNTTRYIMEFFPQEGSQEYEMLQSCFYRQAKADFSDDPEGYTFGIDRYYAAPMKASSGEFVWALSDSIAEKDLGNRDVIQAASFYGQSYYDEIPSSYGVFCESNEKCNLAIQGEVSALSTDGESYGLSVSDECDVELGPSSRLEANGSSRPYRKLKGKADLFALLGDSKGSGGFYPKANNITTYIVEWNSTESAGIRPGNSGNLTQSNNASVQTPIRGQEPEKLTSIPNNLPQNVTVNFSNLDPAHSEKTQSFSRVTKQGASFDSAGALPRPNDYTVANSEGKLVTNVFLGWEATGQIGRPVWLPEVLSTLTVDAEFGSYTGTVELRAKYVAVPEGSFFVRFIVDGTVYGYAAAPDTVANVDKATGFIDSIINPVHVMPGEKATFAGWSFEGSDELIEGNMPNVTSEMTFVAHFDSVVTDQNITVYRFGILSGKTAYYSADRLFPYGSNISSWADSLADSNEPAYDGAKVKSFLGWSVRRSDKEPIYVGDLPLATQAQSYFGIYDERPRLLDVNFYVGDKLHAKSAKVLASRTVNQAFRASTNPVKPGKNADGLFFRGWSLVPGGTPVNHVVKPLMELATAEEPINLYAVYYDPLADAASAKPNNNQNDSSNKSSALHMRSNAPFSTLTGSGPSGRPGIKELAAQQNAAAGTGDTSAMSSTANSADAATESGLSPEVANTVGFFGAVGTLGLISLGTAINVARNRKLDREENYFEPDASTEGRQVRF